MDRWALLEHTVSNSSLNEVHFDFLVENGPDCLTWKIFELPKLNGPLVKIKQQPNHRLVWLITEYQKLSRERGYVRRIAFGNYVIVENNFSKENFSLKLSGELLIGIFRKKGNECQLCGNI